MNGNGPPLGDDVGSESVRDGPLRLVARFVRWLLVPGRPAEQDRRSHVTYVVMLSLFLGTPSLMGGAGEGQERVSLFGMTLPATCTSQQWFGTSCPGCGLTRSFVALTHGRIVDSLRWHRLGLLLYAFFLCQLAFRFRCLMGARPPTGPRWEWAQHYVPLTMILLLMANWFGGLFGSGNGWGW